MIVVDTGVRIDHLIDRSPEQVRCLRAMILDGLPRLVVGGLVLCEVLQGVASDKEARLVEAALRRFDVQAMVDPRIPIRFGHEPSSAAEPRDHARQDHRHADRDLLHRTRPRSSAQRP